MLWSYNGDYAADERRGLGAFHHIVFAYRDLDFVQIVCL